MCVRTTTQSGSVGPAEEKKPSQNRHILFFLPFFLPHPLDGPFNPSFPKYYLRKAAGPHNNGGPCSTLYFCSRSSISKSSNLPTDMPAGPLWLLFLKKTMRKPKMHFPSEHCAAVFIFLCVRACVRAACDCVLELFQRITVGE